MEISVQTDQINMLEEFFNGLSNVDQRKIFIAGFRKAAKPLVTAAKGNAPYRKGELNKSIGTIEKREEIAIMVGAKLSGANKGWHGHFTENGTVERFRKKKKDAPTGRVVGSHWFERAYNATQEQVYGSIEQEWYQAIDNFIIRTNKKIK